MSFFHRENIKKAKRENGSRDLRWRGFPGGRKHTLRSGASIRGCIAVLLLLCGSAAWGQVTVKKIDYEGWKDCWEISNPVVKLVVVPQIGGRIMEYSIDGENVIWQNEKELGKITGSDVGRTWRNYGGHKAWNAPQSRWHTTDHDCYYDSKPAQVEPLPGGCGIRVTCAPIEHLGYQFLRDIELSLTTSRVRVTERMRNISDHDITWSVWGVTQVKVPCWIAFPINEHSKFEDGWNVIYPVGKKLTQIRRVGSIGIMRYNNATENWATDAMAGWMAYIKGQLAFTKQWATRSVGVTYPDGGCDAAFYTCRADSFGGYAEMEVMGPIVTLKPGEETILVEDWFLTRLNQSAKDDNDVIERLKLLQKRGLLPRGIRF